jgi:hypothetical protein
MPPSINTIILPIRYISDGRNGRQGVVLQLGVGRRLASHHKITSMLPNVKASDLRELLNVDESSGSPNGAEFLE